MESGQKASCPSFPTVTMCMTVALVRLVNEPRATSAEAILNNILKIEDSIEIRRFWRFERESIDILRMNESQENQSFLFYNQNTAFLKDLNAKTKEIIGKDWASFACLLKERCTEEQWEKRWATG